MCALSVTEQTRAHPRVTLIHNPTTSVEGKRFLFTVFHPWGRWKRSRLEPCSHTKPSVSLAPHQAISQKHAQKFPKSLCVPKSAARTVLHPFWKVLLWVSELPSCHSSSLFQDLEYTLLSLHVVVQGSMCHVTVDHSRVQGGTCPKRVISLYVLQRSRNLHS